MKKMFIRFGIVGNSQCDQIGRFFMFLVINFLTKEPKYSGNFWAISNTTTFM